MTDISGLSGSVVYDNEPNAAQALLSMAAPPLVPDDGAFTAAGEEDNPIAPIEMQPSEAFPRQAGWMRCHRRLLRPQPATPIIFPLSIPTITAFTACSSASHPDCARTGNSLVSQILISASQD